MTPFRRRDRGEFPAEVAAHVEFARAIVETVRAPLLVLDERLMVLFANPELERVFALGPEEAVGQSFFALGGGLWDRPELREQLGRVLPRAEEIRDLRLQGRATDGSLRDMVINARRVQLEGADRDFILLSVEDETDRATLRRQLEEHARQLERSNRDLQDFAHTASHDLQEPLRKIRLYVDHLGAAIDPATLDERTRRQFERLPEAVRRMQQRIDDLLQLARLSRQCQEPTPTDLGEIVAAVLDDLEVAVSEHGSDVSVGDLPVVTADPAQMRVLFQNLLSNALKYHAPGRRPTVRIHALAPDEDAAMHRIVVEDDGIGFDPQHAERIFGAFQRLHGRDEYPGSGLGLAICRRIAELHHGGITAEGRPGAGARFIVRLPRRPPNEEAT